MNFNPWLPPTTFACVTGTQGTVTVWVSVSSLSAQPTNLGELVVPIIKQPLWKCAPPTLWALRLVKFWRLRISEFVYFFLEKLMRHKNLFIIFQVCPLLKPHPYGGEFLSLIILCSATYIRCTLLPRHVDDSSFSYSQYSRWQPSFYHHLYTCHISYLLNLMTQT
mgnify:CR=1 FL=1